MADMTPAAKPALLSLLDVADARVGELNVLLAYAVDPPDHEAHLDVVQALIAALGALRTDVDAL